MSQASMFIQPDTQFFDNNGLPLAGGKLYFYQAGSTSILKAAYSSSAGTVPLSNPVTLDSSGRAKIWLDGYYYVVLKDALGNIIWTEDNVSSAYSPAAVTTPTMTEWVTQTDVLTYIGVTQFSVPGDRTSVYIVGRRIKATVTAGIITGSITVSSSGGGPIKTTVTVLWDLSEALDSGLSAVSLGITTPIANSLPIQIPIGGILPWYKTLTGVPALAYGWVQCDGQTLSDPLSPINGQVIPNLNGASGGADTFSNSKASVFLRGGNTSGSYSADAIKAHNHATSAITVNAHTHNLAGGSSTAGASLVGSALGASINSYNQGAQAGSGTAVSNLWQKGGSGLNPSIADTSVTLSGHGDVASANGLTGSTDNNGAATETIPKTVSVVFIMRVK